MSDETNFFENEEVLIRNTFLNSKNAPIADIFMKQNGNLFNQLLLQEHQSKLRWTDQGQDIKEKLESMVVPHEDIIKQKQTVSKKSYVKSCIKVKKPKKIIIFNTF